jgi:hypothetical protein
MLGMAEMKIVTLKVLLYLLPQGNRYLHTPCCKKARTVCSFQLNGAKRLKGVTFAYCPAASLDDEHSCHGSACLVSAVSRGLSRTSRTCIYICHMCVFIIPHCNIYTTVTISITSSTTIKHKLSERSLRFEQIGSRAARLVSTVSVPSSCTRSSFVTSAMRSTGHEGCVWRRDRLVLAFNPHLFTQKCQGAAFPRIGKQKPVLLRRPLWC